MAIFPQGLGNIDRRCANGGERALLYQLKRCLSDDYLVWHDVPVGPKARQPDFVLFSPRRGLLILEVKHWAWGAVRCCNRDSVELITDRGLVTVPHPNAQARAYALELNMVLQGDPELLHEQEPFRGKSRVPYGWGSVLSNVRRRQVAGTDFADVFPEFKTLLRDDLDESVDPYAFEKRLWGMFVLTFPFALSLPQRDRVRWHLFPEIRMQQASLLDPPEMPGAAPLPDLMQVMDLQQEQVARTLGEGHRVIHGSAGSGKTMILIFRAQQLAAAARPGQPILVLCYNRALAKRIDNLLRQRGVDERVLVRTFHGWCQDMVRSYQLDPHRNLRGDAYYQALTRTVDRAVQTGLVPGGQYSALLIDEAHDFEDAWLQMAARMVSPATNALLVLYDDAQSIYQKKRRRFNFAGVGIQAQGRTSILRLNYRNTAEVLALALHCAQSLLVDRPGTDETVQTVHPASAGRRGPVPLLLQAIDAEREAALVAGHIAEALAQGRAPGEIAVLFRVKRHMDLMRSALQRHGIAVQSMNQPGFRVFDWSAPEVKLITLHSAKGLEFALVYVTGVDAMPYGGQPMDEELRLLYVAMTRATEVLVLSAAGNSAMVQRVKNALEAVAQQFTGAGQA